MSLKTRKSQKHAAPTKIATTRRDYLQAKRLYHKIGEKAFGARSGSRVKHDYDAVKREYHALGRQLANLTGRKSRHK